MKLTQKQWPIVLLVILVAGGLGIGAAWVRLGRSLPWQGIFTPKPPVATVLLPEGQTVTLTGKAFCGACFWNVGEAPHNLVLRRNEPPEIVYLLENEKVQELEAITGACADGSLEVTATGTTTRYRNRNYLLVADFVTDAQHTAPPSSR